jgi:hypothetical protein
MIEADARQRVEEKLAAAGAQILPFAVARQGVSVGASKRGGAAKSGGEASTTTLSEVR